MSRTSGGITTKIVGGKPVPDGKYRFQAALLAQSFGTNDYQRQYCGGSLITPVEVLTAAGSPGYIQAGITRWGIGCGATGSRGLHPSQQPGVGNSILSVTGGVPVNSAQAA